MSKFICLCGNTFRNKKECQQHIEISTMAGHAERHSIFKNNWRGRVLDVLLWFFDRKTLKFIGAYMIYITLICHFDIHFSIWESVFMGLGLGLAVD